MINGSTREVSECPPTTPPASKSPGLHDLWTRAAHIGASASPVSRSYHTLWTGGPDWHLPAAPIGGDDPLGLFGSVAGVFNDRNGHHVPVDACPPLGR
jgi:hypothetical protein